jgi:hypothetical protein
MERPFCATVPCLAVDRSGFVPPAPWSLADCMYLSVRGSSLRLWDSLALCVIRATHDNAEQGGQRSADCGRVDSVDSVDSEGCHSCQACRERHGVYP